MDGKRIDGKDLLRYGFEGIKLQQTIRIIGPADGKKASAYFWKSLKEGDEFDLVFVLKTRRQVSAPMVEIWRNGSKIIEGTSTITTRNLSNFNFEVL